MLDLLKTYLLYPLAGFAFDFLGDRPWLIAIIVALIAIVIWRFLWPVVVAFNTLFGWKGWALIALSFWTLGAFGAGWRAHRDSQYGPNQANENALPPTKAKPKPKSKAVTQNEDANSMWYKVKHGLPLN